jgi:hypothetical protein
MRSELSKSEAQHIHCEGNNGLPQTATNLSDLSPETELP